MSKNKIPLDELLSKVGLNSSGKQGKSAPFAITPVLLMLELPTSEWSKSFDKFVLDVKYSAYAGVCTLLHRTQKHLPNAGAIDFRIL